MDNKYKYMLKNVEEEKNLKNNKELYSDLFDVLKDLGKIHSRIKLQITSDFIYAKLDDKSKEFVIEMTINAFDILKVYNKAYLNLDEIYHKGIYQDKKFIKSFIELRDDSFDTFMNRVFMVVNLNRNVNDNYMINILAQIEKIKSENNISMENISNLKDKAKEKLLENKNV